MPAANATDRRRGTGLADAPRSTRRTAHTPPADGDGDGQGRQRLERPAEQQRRRVRRLGRHRAVRRDRVRRTASQHATPAATAAMAMLGRPTRNDVGTVVRCASPVIVPRTAATGRSIVAGPGASTRDLGARVSWRAVRARAVRTRPAHGDAPGTGCVAHISAEDLHGELPQDRPLLVALTALVIGAVLLIGSPPWCVLAASIHSGTAGGSSTSLYPPEAVTAQGAQIRELYTIVFLIAVVIFFVVEGLIVWTVIRYRRKPGDDVLPPQTHGNASPRSSGPSSRRSSSRSCSSSRGRP